MFNFKRFTTTCLATAALSLGATAVSAQTQPEYNEPEPPAGPQQNGAAPAQQQGAQGAGESSLSDSQLELYAKAAQKVEGINQELQQNMLEAEDQDEARKLQADAQQEMVNAVQSLGMTAEEYNEIAKQLQSDPAAMERLQEILNR